MLLNAGIAGGIFAAYLTVLVLQLNLPSPCARARLARWCCRSSLLHGTFVALVFYGVLLVRHLFAETCCRPVGSAFSCSSGCA